MVLYLVHKDLYFMAGPKQNERVGIEYTAFALCILKTAVCVIFIFKYSTTPNDCHVTTFLSKIYSFMFCIKDNIEVMKILDQMTFVTRVFTIWDIAFQTQHTP